MTPKEVMRIFSWNCYGLTNPLTIHHLRRTYNSSSPDVLFLMETKNNSFFVRRILNSFGYVDMLAVSPIGMAEGMAEGITVA